MSNMDLNDYSQQKTLPWKPIAIISSVVILVIVVIFIVVRLIQSGLHEEVLIKNWNVQELVTCETYEDPEGCREGLVSDIAVAEGSEEICELLETQEDQDNCYWAVSRTNQDIRPCSLISISEDAGRCEDDVIEAKALEVADLALCAQISDSARASRCEEAIKGPITSNNCVERRPEACADVELFEEAKLALQTTKCNGILDEAIRLSCFDVVEDQLEREADQQTKDTDQDGLIDVYEAMYLTDPERSDTDGDGYLDGAEVNAGYNPNGTGKLE